MRKHTGAHLNTEIHRCQIKDTHYLYHVTDTLNCMQKPKELHEQTSKIPNKIENNQENKNFN